MEFTTPTPQPAIPNLPDTILDVIDCPRCGGDGELLEAQPAFNARQEQWYPNLRPVACPTCNGVMQVEVESCRACRLPVEKCECAS